jgi:pimeloyl-ACP methyl ester carboxylesterase
VGKKTIVTVLVTGLVLGYGFAAHRPGAEPVNAQDDTGEGNYASVNGLELYYEIHGSGQPLILLHGGLGGIVEFSQLLPALAETRQVIAVELQAHGRTADIDRPLSFEFMADDIAALIENLGLEKADILGFSLGGGVALRTAIDHPEVVNKLVLVSTAYRRAGIRPEFLAGMSGMNADAAQMMLETPMYQFYSSVAPNLEDWPTLVSKVGELLAQDYDWSEDVAAITAPTLIVVGDSDYIPPSHGVELFGLLGGDVAGDFVGMPVSQLAVLPGTSHFTILTRTDLLLPVITPFLDAPMPQ